MHGEGPVHPVSTGDWRAIPPKCAHPAVVRPRLATIQAEAPPCRGN